MVDTSWKDRLRAESARVAAGHQKLCEFIGGKTVGGGATFVALNSEERTLLVEQAELTGRLKDVLTERLRIAGD